MSFLIDAEASPFPRDTSPDLPPLHEDNDDRAFIDDDINNPPHPSDHQHLDNDAFLRANSPALPTSPSPNPRLDDDAPHGQQTCPPHSISAAVEMEDTRFQPPSVVVKQPFLASGSFVAGYVVESVGSHSSGSVKGASPTRINGKGRRGAAKKQKTETRPDWHAVYIADETSMLRVWCNSPEGSAPTRAACVARLSQICAGTYVSLVLLTGPVEVRFSNPRFKKYKICTNNLEVTSFKAKELEFSQKPPVPSFELIVADAIEVETWTQVNNIIDSGSGIEVSCTLAVLGVNGRHSPLIARNGTPYLQVYVQDKEGTSITLNVWAQLAAFLAGVPEDVRQKHVVVRFTRLRAKFMQQAGQGGRSRVASVTANTTYEVLPTSFDEFCNMALPGAVAPDSLNGFF